jgi:alkylation response protein AidB-like acyl-CoA dehydrogenase
MNPYEHRRRNVVLTDDEQTVAEAFADFFGSVVTPDRVRAAEETGFDSDLWQQIVEMGVTSMALPEAVGGDGAGVIELALVAEQVGRVLAPVPVIDHLVASRLLADADDAAFADVLLAAAEGDTIIGFAARQLDGRQLVSSAAVADHVVGFDGEHLVVVSSSTPRTRVTNRASLPAAWVDPASEEVRVVTATAPGDLFRRARDEWDVLTAAALAGLSAASVAIGAESTKSRETQGIALAKLQGVAFPLVDAHIGVTSARNLALRAAWFLDNDPASERHLSAAALVYAHDVATRATNIAAHVQGGLGFTNEAATTPYVLRAHAWALTGGDLRPQRRRIAREALAVRRVDREAGMRLPVGIH